MDVEKVPRPRWKLTCTICQQKMGACIQCGNKNCFRAFHVTCARRAKWCLQMKSSHGGPASLDASVLKAFCDKHVPREWAEANDVAGATAEAVQYYRFAMKGKTWTNSQQAALSLQPFPRHDTHLAAEEPLPKINLIVKDDKGKKKKPPNPPKSMWRLPSGAPVIPAVVYDSVENLLQRMTIRKRKEFASDMCRYWTLKREARRGAPLIKRLQLQMEMFSSMEITRRDFAAMGAAGGPRLQRRKSFTQLLQKDTEQLKRLSDLTIQKQQSLVDDDGTLDTILDLVYFPIVPLLRPVMQKALV
jgi:NuA3 HAT complex component NTO1